MTIDLDAIKARPTLFDKRLPDRFWAKVSPEPNSGCWLWTGSSVRDYGQFFWNGRMRLAHRVTYETLVGGIPYGLCADHLCRNERCVNPSHIEPVTSAENTRRGEAGLVTGEKNRAKTHCQRGHEYTPGNTIVASGGNRHCVACRQITQIARRFKRRMQAVKNETRALREALDYLRRSIDGYDGAFDAAAGVSGGAWRHE